MSAVLALRKAIFERLSADRRLAALLKGGRIHDVPPKDAAFPFVSLGEAMVSDWSTGTEQGTEQMLTLHAFSRAAGRREAFALASAIQDALHETDLPLKGHRLANLRATTSEIRRTGDGRTFHALIRLRAVTETA